MSKHYEAEFRKKIVRLHLEEGRTLKGLAAEYGVSKASISIWVKEFREECRTNNEAKSEYDYMKENLQRDFKADTINQKWCIDFTYLFLTDGSKRYNCTIIDLHERIVIASITDKHMTADLAKRTLQKAINSQPGLNTFRSSLWCISPTVKKIRSECYKNA